MQIALSINVLDQGEVERRIALATAFLPVNGLIHIDVGDGAYTPEASWGDAAAWRGMASTLPGVMAEIHLMALDWEVRLVPWLEAGAKRVIIPIDLLSLHDARRIADIASRYGAVIMPSIPPGISTDVALPYIGIFHAFQLLAVHPGRSGQAFDPATLAKIVTMRAAFPDAILEIDGGVTPDILLPAKTAGADIAVSSSYVWNAIDPQVAYDELVSI